MPIRPGKKIAAKARPLVFNEASAADSPYKGLESEDIYKGLDAPDAEKGHLSNDFGRALFGDAADEPGALHKAAKRMLPVDDSPEIRTAIELCSDINITSLITARIIEDSYRGFLPDNRVDGMTTAMLLVGSPNFREIAGQFEEDTIQNAFGFTLAHQGAAAALKGGKTAFEDLPQDGRRMMVANIAAFMEIIDKGYKIGQKVEISKEEFIQAGLAVVLESRAQNAIKTDEDKALLKRTADIFNKVAELTDQRMVLKKSEYDTFVIVPRKPKGFLSPKP